MNRSLIVIGLFFAGILICIGPAGAGDTRVVPWRYNNHSRDLPYARSVRAASVWASGRCWSECGVILRVGDGGLPQSQLTRALSQVNR